MLGNTEIFIVSELEKCNSCTCSCIEPHVEKSHSEECVGGTSLGVVVDKNAISVKEVQGLALLY